jgi:hypothetical protein
MPALSDLPDMTRGRAHQTLVEASAMEASPAATHDPEAWVERVAASLRTEREGIREFLAVQEQRLEQAEAALQESLERLEDAVTSPPAEASDATDGDNVDQEYKRRYEMALDDLRELKASNSILQEQLARARSNASALAKEARSPGAPLDWESEKLRILAALESDLDVSNAERRVERLKMEDVIRATDQIIAKKDNEIRELREQLAKSDDGGQADAAQAAAVTKAVDSDAAIQEERKRLKQIEQQWQSKLSQAEIELSLERAKLARERNELEERLRSAENVVSKAAALADAADEASRPSRSRWMSRLGLTDADRERGRRG